jgi:hypothetical protein
VAVVHGRARPANTAVGGNGVVWFSQLPAQRLRDGPRDSRDYIDLVKRVAVSLQEPDLVEAQSEDLIAIDRLKKTPQRFRVKALGHDGKFGDRPLKPEYSKEARPAQYGQPVQRMIPEIMIVSQRFKWLQKNAGLVDWMLLEERYLQLLYKIAKPDWVLLILGTAPMGRLIKRETWRLVNRG